MDHVIDDDRLLERVSTAFEPYLLSSQDLRKIRRSLQCYVASQIEESRNDCGQQGLEGLRAEYVNAVRANRAAKRRYEALIAEDERVSTTTTTVTSKGQAESEGSRSLLDQHVELLRLQRQHTTLVTLRDEFDALRRCHGRRFTSIDTRPCATLSMSGVSAHPEVESELAHLAESLKRSIKGLERAMVEAHREAIRERTLLEKVKTQGLGLGDATPEQRLRALSVTRRELTAWLEASLERCQGDNTSQHEEREWATSTNTSTRTSSVEAERLVDDQYEQYLEARKRVLAALSSLKAPLPEHTSETSDGNAAYMAQVSTNSRRSERVGVVNQIEQTLLPALQQQTSTHAQLVFTKEQQEAEIQKTINILDRLSDESQILLAFPLLARSGRFKHAASTFGKKVMAKDEAKDEVSKRLEPWLFAAEAAEVASTSTIEAQLRQGQESMDRISQNLAELRLLREAQG